jgi:hypothetical protein
MGTFADAQAWMKNCIFRLSRSELTVDEAIKEFREILSQYGINSKYKYRITYFGYNKHGTWERNEKPVYSKEVLDKYIEYCKNAKFGFEWVELK